MPMRLKYFISSFLLFIGTLSAQQSEKVSIQKIDTILARKMSVRAILVDKNKLWFAADQNVFGYYDCKKKKITEKKLLLDNRTMEFRSIAQTKHYVFVANVGSPACIFRIDKKTLDYSVVFQDNHKDAFLDSMVFMDNDTGIVVGDPTDNCLTILITNDGGKHWEKVPCEMLPKTEKGEAAFAASNSNVVVKGSKIWIVSGGVKSRVFYSENGKDFVVNDLPIVQGLSMTGAFTADFYNDRIGFVAGGDYEKPMLNRANKVLTIDGGMSWKTVADDMGFGYTSCVQFVPKSDGRKIVAVGASGVFYSSDSGTTWQKLSDDTTLYTIRFSDEHTFYAAGKDKIVKMEISE